MMAGCRKCGGGGGRGRISTSTVRGGSKSAAPEPEGMVLVEYVGPMVQFQHRTSKVKPGYKYRYGGNPGADSRKFYAFKKDADLMLADNSFRIIPKASLETTNVVEEMPVLEAFTRPAPPDFSYLYNEPELEAEPIIEVSKPISVSQLNLSPETISILESAGYDTVDSLKYLSTAQLVSIKGIGATRAKKIMEAVKEVI